MDINIDWLIILKSSEQIFIWTLEKKARHSVVVGVCSVEVTILETALANISIFISMRI